MKLLKSNADIIKRLESVDFINVEMEKEQAEMNEKANAKCNQPCVMSVNTVAEQK